MKQFFVSKLLIWRQNWVTGVQHETRSYSRSSSIVVMGRTVTMLFWYAVPRQIKPGILKLTIRRGQSNLSIVFIFVTFDEKCYYRVFSVR